jgi:outer membrane protein W
MSTVWAEQGDMKIRFGVLYQIPTGDLVVEDQKTELDDALGFQAGFEYLLTDWIGVEPTMTYSKSDVNVTEDGVPDLELGEIGLLTLAANLNFHILRETRLDLYLGPTIGYGIWGDLETDLFPQDFKADDKFVYGINVGLDVPFGESGWGFAGALNYLAADLTLEGSSDDIGFDPVQLKVGVVYKF